MRQEVATWSVGMKTQWSVAFELVQGWLRSAATLSLQNTAAGRVRTAMAGFNLHSTVELVRARSTRNRDYSFSCNHTRWHAACRHCEGRLGATSCTCHDAVGRSQPRLHVDLQQWRTSSPPSCHNFSNRITRAAASIQLRHDHHQLQQPQYPCGWLEGRMDPVGCALLPSDAFHIHAGEHDPDDRCMCEISSCCIFFVVSVYTVGSWNANILQCDV